MSIPIVGTVGKGGKVTYHSENLFCEICQYPINEAPYSLTNFRKVCDNEKCKRIYSWKNISDETRIKRLKSVGVGNKFIRDNKPPKLVMFKKGVIWNKKSVTNISNYICGPVGKGKTWLLCCMMTDAFEHGYIPRLINWQWLRIEIRSTYQNAAKNTEYEIIKSIANIEYLCLDDIGAGKESEAERDLLYTILDRRYANNLITKITSNLPIQDLGDRYDLRIQRRIKEMCEVIVLK